MIESASEKAFNKYSEYEGSSDEEEDGMENNIEEGSVAAGLDKLSRKLDELGTKLEQEIQSQRPAIKKSEMKASPSPTAASESDHEVQTLKRKVSLLEKKNNDSKIYIQAQKDLIDAQSETINDLTRLSSMTAQRKSKTDIVEMAKESQEIQVKENERMEKVISTMTTQVHHLRKWIADNQPYVDDYKE
ncbi:hypothetical protein HDU97_003428 [Phlyctochytrium planicorne]|nr:hypothetical protein HDU97_003428 [Phlyctochytrium planicorne]